MSKCTYNGAMDCYDLYNGNCLGTPCKDITNTNYQPSPKPGGQVVYTELIKDIESRAAFGRSKYGQDLMTNDGRDTEIDLYQELLDACFYQKKKLMERSKP